MTISYRKMLIPTKQDIRRFWKFVDKQGIDNCWICNCTPSTVYPQFYYGGKAEGRLVDASRFVYLITYKDPYKLLVLHSCDNTRCVNFRHLSLGTDVDNMQDMIAKGRLGNRGWSHLSGENHPNAVLNWDKASEIKIRLKKKETCASIAKEYNVSREAISAIKNGYTWKEKVT